MASAPGPRCLPHRCSLVTKQMSRHLDLRALLSPWPHFQFHVSLMLTPSPFFMRLSSHQICRICTWQKNLLLFLPLHRTDFQTCLNEILQRQPPHSGARPWRVEKQVWANLRELTERETRSSHVLRLGRSPTCSVLSYFHISRKIHSMSICFEKFDSISDPRIVSIRKLSLYHKLGCSEQHKLTSLQFLKSEVLK